MSENSKKGVIGEKKWLLLILAAALGVGLLLFGGWGRDGTETESAVEHSYLSLDPEAYARSVEEQIVKMCERVEGAGRVYAVVTLKGGYRAVYATDSQSSSGGYKNNTVLIGSGSAEQGILICYQNPEIAGVGIVCDGGGETGIRAELISLVSAAFNIPSHKIYVSGT